MAPASTRNLIQNCLNSFFQFGNVQAAPVRLPTTRSPLKLIVVGEHFKPGARKSRGVVHLIGWAASWNTILSPKLTISTFGFGGSARCSGGAFSYDPTAPWAIFASSCRSALTGGLPSPSLSHPQEELRGATGAVRPSPVARRARRSASEESAEDLGN